MRGVATLPQGVYQLRLGRQSQVELIAIVDETQLQELDQDQELLVVRDKVGRPPGELGVSSSCYHLLHHPLLQ